MLEYRKDRSPLLSPKFFLLKQHFSSDYQQIQQEVHRIVSLRLSSTKGMNGVNHIFHLLMAVRQIFFVVWVFVLTNNDVCNTLGS